MRNARPLACLVLTLVCAPALLAQEAKLDEQTRALIPELLKAPDATAREALLAAHPGAATNEFVYALLQLGEDRTNHGQFEEALHAQDVAREIVQRAKLGPLMLGICDWMRSTTLQTSGRAAEAVDVLASAFAAVRNSKNKALISMIARDRADLLTDLGRLAEARAAAQEALALANEFDDAGLRCEALMMLSKLDAQLGDANTALKSAQEAVAQGQAAGKVKLQAAALHNLGNTYSGLGDYSHALESHQQALDLRRKAEDITGTAGSLNACAIDLKNLGRYSEALASYEEALVWADRGKRPSVRATVEDNMGSVLLLLGDQDRATALHLEAVKTFREIGDRLGLGMALMHLGLLEKGRGHFDPALQYFDEALAVYEAAGSVPDQISILVNRANTLSLAERRDDALATVQKAAVLCAKLTAAPELAATTYVNIAMFNRDLGRRDLFRDCLEKAWSIGREGTSPGLRAVILGALADVKRDDGDPQGADELLGQALALAPAGSSDYFDLLESKAQVAFERGERRKAVQVATDGLALARQYGRRGPEAQFLVQLGTALLPQTKELEGEAPPDPAAAAKSLEEAVTAAEALSRPTLIQTAHYFCGKAYAALGDDKMTLTHYLAAARTLEGMRAQVGGQAQRLRLAADAARLYRLIALRYAAAGDAAQAFTWSESAKARVLADALADRRLPQAAGQEDPELAAREQQALALMATASQKLDQELAKPAERRSEEALKQWTAARTGAEDDLRFVQLELRRRDPRYAQMRYPEPLSLEEARKLLPEGTALIDYVLGNEQSVALVVTHEATRVVRLPVGEQQVAAVWGRMQSTLEMAKDRAAPPDPTAYATAAHELYAELVAPALDALPARPKRIVLAPDGVLHYVPFAALVTEVPGGARSDFRQLRYLGREVTVAYVPSATVLGMLLQSRPQPETNPTLVAFCDPALPMAPTTTAPAAVTRAIGSWAPLKAAAEEGQALKTLWKGEATIFVGPDADERTAKVEATKATAIHFAAHGLADDASPLYSALALSPTPAAGEEPAEDGYLYAYEVMQLERTAPLVVLSACETALGAKADGEGLVGLVRAFLAAGSRTVIASLWSVDDQATAALMRAFYEELRKGDAPDEALAAAQRRAMDGKLRGAAYASAPYFWAAFAPYGDTSLSPLASRAR